jgi:hypothetical protein
MSELSDRAVTPTHPVQMQAYIISGYLYTDTVCEDDSGIRGAVEYRGPTIPEHPAITEIDPRRFNYPGYRPLGYRADDQ